MKDTKQIVEEYLPKLIAACAIEKIKRVIAQNEDKWITIHPHGKDGGDGESKDYRRLLIKDGETVEDAMHRQGYYNKRKAKDEKKEKEGKNNKKDLKTIVDDYKAELRKIDDKFEEINKEGSVYSRTITQIWNDYANIDEAKKHIQQYKEDYKKELADLEKRYNELTQQRKTKQKELDAILEKEVDEIVNTEIDGLDKDNIDNLIKRGKELFRMPIIYPLQLKLQEKILDLQKKVSGLKYQSTRKEVKEIAGVKKGKPMTFKKADSGNVNPSYGKNTPGLSYSKNCQSCVVGYNLRVRGFDVKTKGIPVNAKGDVIKSGKMYELAQYPEKAWIDPKTGLTPELNICDVTTPRKAYDWLDKNVKDGIYSFRFVWKGNRSGHIVIAHRVNGNLEIYDPQNNWQYKDKDSIMQQYLNECKLKTKWKEHKPYIFRTDNMDVNKEYADAIMEKS